MDKNIVQINIFSVNVVQRKIVFLSQEEGFDLSDIYWGDSSRVIDGNVDPDFRTQVTKNGEGKGWVVVYLRGGNSGGDLIQSSGHLSPKQEGHEITVRYCNYE